MPEPIPSELTTVVLDPAEAARAAKLRYVSDSKPGLSRERVEGGFAYHDVDGSLITDGAVLERIRKLAIPPAYTDVWICRDPRGHLQAVGRDARGRKQYRYHPRWRVVRDEAKYGKMLIFGRVLPKIREQVKHDMALHGLPKRKVLAAIVALLEKTMMRIGNEEYAKQNKSFGLTTLRNRHARVKGSHLELRLPRQARHQPPHRPRRPPPRPHRRALPRPAGAGPVPVPRPRRRAAQHRLGGRERIPARDHRRGDHRQGLPHLGGDQPGGDDAGRTRALRHPGRGQEGGGHGGRERRQAARQHAGDLPQVLHPPSRVRGLPGRQPRRGAEAARRRTAGPARPRASPRKRSR